MTTIDDKAVEAAARAIWLAEPLRANSIRKTAWEDESDATHERYRPLARAALEAADKVLAEGLDVEETVKGVFALSKAYNNLIATCILEQIQSSVASAFAAGLAKAEAERAALRVALDAMRNAIIKADIALALAQKDGT